MQIGNQYPKDQKSYRNRLFGYVIFAIISVVFSLNILPGKIVFMGPSGSGSLSGGGTTISCEGNLGPFKTNSTYNNKRGFPLTYSYLEKNISVVDCDGVIQDAGQSEISETNLLFLVTNILLAALLAVLITKIVNKIRR